MFALFRGESPQCIALNSVKKQFNSNGLLVRVSDSTYPTGSFPRSPPYPTTLLQETTAPILFDDPKFIKDCPGITTGRQDDVILSAGFIFKNSVHKGLKCGYPVDGNSDLRPAFGLKNKCVCSTETYEPSDDANRLQVPLFSTPTILKERNKLFDSIDTLYFDPPAVCRLKDYVDGSIADYSTDDDDDSYRNNVNTDATSIGNFSTGLEIEVLVRPSYETGFFDAHRDLLAFYIATEDGQLPSNVTNLSIRNCMVIQNSPNEWIKNLGRVMDLGSVVNTLPIITIANVALTTSWEAGAGSRGYKHFWERFRSPTTYTSADTYFSLFDGDTCVDPPPVYDSYTTTGHSGDGY